MSAPVALKAVSHRDSLAKTVRLLTRDGIDVQFRGHQPMVIAKGNKAYRLVLPELNDSASPELLEAIQGFLDHEVGHIFYTPFAKAGKAGAVDRKAPALLNIVEDIRLEKLLPRDLPGTRENLERMYDRFIPMMVHPATEKMVATGNPSKQIAGVMVPAMRALAGQKAFQAYMDANGYWPHFMPLMKRLPDLAKRLRALETYDDVIALVDDMLEAMKPPAKPERPQPPEKPQESDSDPDQGDDAGDDQDDASGPDSGPDDDDAADDDDQGDDEPGDDGDDGEPGDDDDDGEGHGDGAGTDDEKGDDDDTSTDGADDKDQDGGNGDDSKKDEEPAAGGPDGKNNLSLTDALKQLEPTQRKALFMYKQRKQSVSEIATELQATEEVVLDLLRNARRKLGELMKGKRK